MTDEARALPRPVASWIYGAALLGVAIGAAAFGLGATSARPEATWRALLVNFLFWTSLAQGAFMWSVAFQLARTTWSAAAARLGDAMVGFLGLSALLFPGLFLGRVYYLPWLGADLGEVRKWLNAPALFVRDEAGLLLLFALAWAFVRARQRGEAAAEGGDSETLNRAERRLSALGVLLALTYAVVATLLAFDLVMSLTPGWTSTLFGWYYLVGGLYGGVAALIIMLARLRGWLGVTVRTQQYQDLGNLLMAMAMVMTYFFFSQALVIWYENLPSETVFAVPRLRQQPWGTLSIALLALCYLGPFALLVMREMKESPRALTAVSALVLTALAVERYQLVMPSLAPRGAGALAFGLLIGLGFFGLLVLTVAPALARASMAGLLEARLAEEREQWQ